MLEMSFSVRPERKLIKGKTPANSAPWTRPAVTELTSAGRESHFGAMVVWFRDNGLLDNSAFGPMGHLLDNWA